MCSAAGCVYDLLGYVHPFLTVPHDGMNFSSPTVDNDIHPYSNCAADDGGSWWFNTCGLFQPTTLIYTHWYCLPAASYYDMKNIRAMVKLQ